MKGKIILLDLNFTLVSNQKSTRGLTPFSRRLMKEEYRTDLIKAIENNKVILITARPHSQRMETLENIKRKNQFVPAEAYFNEKLLDPPSCKEDILHRYIFPRYGREGAHFFAVESNPRTREMYAKYGISAEPYQAFIRRFPDIRIRDKNEPLDLFDPFL